MTQLGARKGAKAAKRAFRGTLVKAVNRIVATVYAHYDKGSPEVLACVPSGQTDFSTTTDDAMAIHLRALRNGVTAVETTVGSAAVTQANSLLDAWEVIHEASEGASATKTATQQERRVARHALQWRLYANVLELVLLFPRDPSPADLYLPQVLLDGGPRSGNGGGGDQEFCSEEDEEDDSSFSSESS